MKNKNLKKKKKKNLLKSEILVHFIKKSKFFVIFSLNKQTNKQKKNSITP